MKTYKKCIAKPYYFLVNDIILSWDNPLCFIKTLFLKKWIYNSVMTIDDQIKNEKLCKNINLIISQNQ